MDMIYEYLSLSIGFHLPPIFRGLGGVVVRVLTSNLWGRRFESRAGRFMLESR